MRLISRWMRNTASQELTGLQFHNQSKVGRGRSPSPSFLSRRHVSIIHSSSRLSRGVFLSLGGQAGPQMIVFYVFREHLGIINLLSSLGRMWVSPLCCLGSCLMLPLHGFVAKQACSLEPSFNLQGVSRTFSTYRPLMGLTNHLLCPFTLSLSVIQQIFSAVPCYKRPDA